MNIQYLRIMAISGFYSFTIHRLKRQISFFKYVLLLACMLFMVTGLFAQTPDGDNILYVDQNVSGGDGTGNSWANAIPELRDALAWAQGWDGDTDGTLQIWVATGTYYPTSGTERTARFKLKNGVAIFGGFAGDEMSLGQRNLSDHPTILSGDIGTTGDNSDNSYHVVVGNGTDATAHLDGFIITAGNANTTNNNFYGGGMFNNNGSPTLTNLIFVDNNAGFGGGMYNLSSSPTLLNVIFSGNSTDYSGGAMYNNNSNPTLTNVTISRNNGFLNSGGIYNRASNPMLTNVIIWRSGNPGVRNAPDGSSNPTYAYSLIQGLNPGGTNLNGNNSDNRPFINNASDPDGPDNIFGTPDDELHLKPGSLAINAGSNNALPTDIYDLDGDGNNAEAIPYDLAGAHRVQGLIVDLGAYEVYAPNNPPTVGASLADINAFEGGSDVIDLSAVFSDDDALTYSVASNTNTGIVTTSIDNASGRLTLDYPPGGTGTAEITIRAQDVGGLSVTDTFTVTVTAVGPVIYVASSAVAGANNGTSWANAFTDLQDALSAAPAGKQIWVAEGIYYPTSGTDRTASFTMKNGVAIYGGFAGGEATIDQRNPGDHPVILSGDIDNNDNTTNGVTLNADDIDGDNSYHVVTGTNIDNTALLDGVTITGGNASGANPNNRGGGLSCNGQGSGNICSPTLTNIVFAGNHAGYGAAIFNDGRDNGHSSPVMTHAVFIGNRANNNGGAIVNNGSNGNSSPVITNSVFTGNHAGNNGGAILNNGSNGGTSTPVYANSIFWGNSAGGSYDEILNNNANPTLSYSLIDGANPMFVDAANPAGDDGIFGTPDDGLALQAISPAINAGSNQAYIDAGGDLDNDLDLAGEPRVFDGLPDPDLIDIGAYEFQGEPVPIGPDGNNILYVDQNVSGGNGSGSSWADAMPELRDALVWANNNWNGTEPPLQIWVAGGLYLPTDNGTDREATFQLANDVEIYGGFSGGENNVNARDWNENLTILSGDINRNDDEEIITDPEYEIKGNNSLHVVTGSNTDNTALLDGFTITAGRANLRSDDFSIETGGGLLNDDGSPSLVNVVFAGNLAIWGGGMSNLGDSSPVLTNVVFTGNWANYFGGGLMNGGDPTLMNVFFIDNSANLIGGGLYNGGSPILINNTFSRNRAGDRGGGMYNTGNPSLTNATFSGNITDKYGGGGIYNSEGNLTLTNTILWGNTASDSGNEIFIYDGSVSLDFSLYRNRDGQSDIVESGGFTASNSLSEDPLFVDVANPAGDDGIFGTPDDGLALQNTSLAINAGTNAPYQSGGAAEGIITDLAGNDRIYDGGTVDMGAYEFQDEPVTVPDPVVLSSPADEANNVGLTPGFSWESVDGADTYHLQVSEQNDLSDPVIDESGLTGTTFEPTSDLGNSTTYYWQVRASNSVGDGSWSEVFSFTTLPENSEVVILTDPTDETKDVSLSPLFEWNAADGAESYDLVVSPNSDFSDPVIDKDAIESTEFQTSDNLDFSKIYHWRVRGVNSGGPGQWSEAFSFTTQDQPEAADNRILLANPSADGYTFTPADFGVADNNFKVVIDELSGGFNGTFELDANPVSAGNEISLGDIDDEKLTYTPPEGEYGYRYDSFDFSIEDADGNPSETSYTMSLDVAATSVELNGGEGWRFLGNPSHEDRFDDLLRPLWTNGVARSDSPGATFSNVNLLNQQEYQWEAPGDLGNTTKASQPFIVYVYSDDDNDGTPEGFPKTLTSGENWLPLDGSFSFEDLSFDETISNPDNFYLVANPHPLALDFCAFASTNIGTAVTFWNPNANGGNGDYQALNCETLEELPIAPFQAFWIRTTESNPALEIPEEAYLETSTEGYFKESEMKEDLFRIVLNVASENREQGFSNRTELYFAENASATLDEMDAIKLSPEGLANRWLSFYSLDQNHKTYAFQSLPVSHLINDKVSIPLDVQTTESGRFTLDWTLPESHIFNGSYYLRDNKTGEVIELREGTSYDFEITPEQAVQTKQAGTTHPMSELAENGVIALDTHRMSSVAAPRFELLIAAAGVDGLTELGAVPEQFELGQNYPNPFNPTTVIRYQLPVSSEVRLEVYDMLGRNVATLVDEQVSAGRHSVNFDAGNLSSGIYLYRLEAGSQIMTRKLTVVK